jgi:hypothetical protein
LQLGANYQYSHSIDDAAAVNGTSPRVAQNWQDLQAEEGNSSFDIRHQVSGTYLYELPFGKDKFWVTSGVGSHILEGFSVSGSFTLCDRQPANSELYSYRERCGVRHSGIGAAGSRAGSFSGRGPRVAAVVQPGGVYCACAPVQGYPCAVFGNCVARFDHRAGDHQNNMSLSKTVQMGDTRSMEIRATANNVFNTVQYSGVGTSVTLPTFGQVTSVGKMRSFQLHGEIQILVMAS